MGRPSKLTDAQWESIGKRLLSGESAAALAREFGISKASVSVRFSKRTETIKAVANQIVAVESALSFMNVSEQLAARSLADDLKDISMHLAGAARYSAATAHRLSGIANAKAAEIDDTIPLDEAGLKTIKGIAVMTHMANSAAEIPLNLMKANKEVIDKMNSAGNAPDGLAALMLELNGSALPIAP